MKKAGLLADPQRGIVQLTERGREALTSGPERITVAWLKQFPEFVEFMTTKPPKKVISSTDLTTSVEDEATPDELLASAHLSLKNALADELLRKIQDSTPVFFERLVVDLMIAMGYGGSRKEAGRATQATSDDGIDGTIKEDKLGLDVIYLQAKRWINTVHRPEIDKFIGALTRQKARNGVFITTSDFSPGARESIRNLDMKIVLIDGQEQGSVAASSAHLLSLYLYQFSDAACRREDRGLISASMRLTPSGLPRKNAPGVLVVVPNEGRAKLTASCSRVSPTSM